MVHIPHIRLIFFSLLLILTVLSTTSFSQNRGYELLPSPDLWYNDVDGIRLGLNLLGQVPGSFEDGPHRLRAGIWLGLWFPDAPLSYQLTYTEPMRRWSDFGSEASFQVLSSFRTGYHKHGLGFQKRWQKGFHERRFTELSIFNTLEKRINSEYTPFTVLWADNVKLLTSLSLLLQDENPIGEFSVTFKSSLQYLNSAFLTSSLSAFQRVDFNRHWGVRIRGFSALSSSSSAPEYLVSRSMSPAIEWMANSVTRAKGTIPQHWIESGSFHVAGGANLRGYVEEDVKSLVQCSAEEPHCGILFYSFFSLNSEFDFWNPIDLLFNRNSYTSEFFRFRSYLFYDTGGSPGWIGDTGSLFFSNAGTGFSLSLNIPDHLGKARGFVLRYEIPFWLSDPASGDAFSFRSLFGFGAVITI